MGLRQSDAAAFGHAVWESRSSPLSPSDAESGHAGTLRSAEQQLWWTRRIRKSAGHAEPELQSAGPEPKLRRRRWTVVTSLQHRQCPRHRVAVNCSNCRSERVTSTREKK